MADSVRILDMKPDGEGRVLVDLGSALVYLVTRFNYSAKCWTMDMEDVQGSPILNGLMLVPNVDILHPYTQVRKKYGTFMLVEKAAGEYTKPDMLGVNTLLLWFPPGEEAALPE